MKRKIAGRVAKPRICGSCKGLISETRPVFLLADTSGMILGPFHAGCAARLKYQAASGKAMQEGPFEIWGKLPLEPREETLPW